MNRESHSINSEQARKCQNCQQEFWIEPEDFTFYERIKVPAPTWCPECRTTRRMVQMNDKVLYRGKCALCGKNILSNFKAESKIPIYCSGCWWSDKWDPMVYGRDYDFSKPFFTQFAELFEAVPWPAFHRVESSIINSDYCNVSSYMKNCYLVFNSDYDEDCSYGSFLERSKFSFDMFMGDLCELCYDSSNLFKDFRTIYSSNCNECVDVAFSRNLKNCHDCFGCFNLRNKSYQIFNEPYSKDEYFEKLKSFDTGSWRFVKQTLEKVGGMKYHYPRKYMEGLKNLNVTGDYIFNSKNVRYGYEVGGGEDVKFSHFLFIIPTKSSYDFTMWGGNAAFMYECMGCGGGQNNVRFCYECWCGNTENLEYSINIVSSGKNLFGCIGLCNKQYCILNKQYTKEQYEELVPRIIEHMNKMPYVDSKGRIYKYGEFFPPELSPFSYNETIAQEYFPLTKEQAIEKGYRWRDPDIKDYKITIKTEDLPDHIKDVSDSITNEVIQCVHANLSTSQVHRLESSCNEQCTTAFKIIPQELQFYQRMNLPLPQLCPNCRHYQRLKQRNPLKLWHRKCQCAGQKSENGVYQNTISHQHGTEKCPNEFETSYAPERKEIIYCEQCYNAEVV